MKSRIFIGNLNTAIVTKKQLHSMFCVHGDIKAISMHKGYAFIQYSDEIDALNAVLGQDGHMICGQKIDVNLVTTPKAHQKSSKKNQHLVKNIKGKELSNLTDPDLLVSTSRPPSSSSPSTSVSSSTSSQTVSQLSSQSNRDEETHRYSVLKKKIEDFHQQESCITDCSDDHLLQRSDDEREKLLDPGNSTEIEKSASLSSTASSSYSSQSSHTRDNLSGTSSTKIQCASPSVSCDRPLLFQSQDKDDGVLNCQDFSETFLQNGDDHSRIFSDNLNSLLMKEDDTIDTTIEVFNSSLKTNSGVDSESSLNCNERMNDDSVNHKRHETTRTKSSISITEGRSLEKILPNFNIVQSCSQQQTSSSIKRIKLDSPSSFQSVASSTSMFCDTNQPHPDILICGLCKSLLTSLDSFIEHKNGNKCRLRFVCRCQPNFDEKDALTNNRDSV
jgi:hypothetical protein